MEVRTAHGEESLAELAERLFRTGGSKARAREALAALKRANPHLDPRKAIAPGTPVLVPPVEGLAPAAGPAPAADLAKEAAQELREALHHAGEALGAARARAAAEDEAALAAVKKGERELKALGDDAAGELKQFRDAAKARRKESEGQAKAQEDGLKRLQSSIDKFLKRLG
jgi:hypothetical protein